MNVHEPRKRLEACLKSIRSSQRIPEGEKKLILKFHDECCSQGLSNVRVLFYMEKLKMLAAKWSHKRLSRMDKDDIKELLGKIERSDYSEWTKAGYRITLKKFFQWLHGFEWNSQEYPDEVKWIRTSTKGNAKELPEILTKEDIKKLIRAATNIRDKALISVLYESGCRIGELLNLKLKDIVFDDYGAVIKVHGGKGSRRIRLVCSVPHLSSWIQNHPHREDRDSYLWTSIARRRRASRISYQYVRLKLKKFAERAGVKVPVNPHNFRHSRATHLANKLTEAQMCEYFGWVQGSDMPSTYVHLSGRDVDSAILRIYGRLSRDEEKKEEELKTKECPRCHYENPPESDFCGRCRLPLDEKVAMELEKRKAEFISIMTPEIIERMIEEKVRQILESRTLLARKE